MSPRVKVKRANSDTELVVPVSKITTVTRGEHTGGVVELIICNNGVLGDVVTRRFDPDAEAAEVLDALLALPVETRRALYLLLFANGDTFNGAAQPKRAKVHPFPPRRSR